MPGPDERFPDKGSLLGDRYRMITAAQANACTALRLSDRQVVHVYFLTLDDELRRAIAHPPRVQHAHVLPLLDGGVIHDTLGWVVTPASAMSTLDDELERGKLSTRRAVTVTLQLTSALMALHNCGQPLGNLRPADIVLTATWDGRDEVQIPGSAWLVSAPAGRGCGGYTAPEAAEGDPEPAADQYSLGVLLYEMLTGATPHNPDAHPSERTHLGIHADDGLPKELVPILRRLLQPAAADRYPDMQTLYTALQATQQPEVPGPPVGAFTPVLATRARAPHPVKTLEPLDADAGGAETALSLLLVLVSVVAVVTMAGFVLAMF